MITVLPAPPQALSCVVPHLSRGLSCLFGLHGSDLMTAFWVCYCCSSCHSALTFSLVPNPAALHPSLCLPLASLFSCGFCGLLWSTPATSLSVGHCGFQLCSMHLLPCLHLLLLLLLFCGNSCFRAFVG